MKITEMRSSRNGKFFMAGSSDGKIIVFNSETGELIYTVGLNGASYFALTNNGIATSDGDFYEVREKDFTVYEKRFDVGT